MKATVIYDYGSKSDELVNNIPMRIVIKGHKLYLASVKIGKGKWEATYKEDNV